MDSAPGTARDHLRAIVKALETWDPQHVPHHAEIITPIEAAEEWLDKSETESTIVELVTLYGLAQYQLGAARSPATKARAVAMASGHLREIRRAMGLPVRMLGHQAPGVCRTFEGASCIAWAREGACPHVPEERWLRRAPQDGEWVAGL